MNRSIDRYPYLCLDFIVGKNFKIALHLNPIPKFPILKIVVLIFYLKLTYKLSILLIIISNFNFLIFYLILRKYLIKLVINIFNTD
jgi:hypothetical protein